MIGLAFLFGGFAVGFGIGFTIAVIKKAITDFNNLPM